MDLVLAALNWSHCLVYLDDVIILGRSFREHLNNLQAVLARLQEAGLKLKPAKCQFFQHKVEFLGHIVSRNGIQADPRKIEMVVNWPMPTTMKEIQQFLGFANYYRRFIRDFSQIEKPLHHLTESKSVFAWTNECLTAFTELRHRLTSAPVLAYPDFKQPFILDTDASRDGICAVLSQIDEQGQERAIAYGSRLLSKAERQYCVTCRELLAVVTFTKQFKPYLTGHRLLLCTDHGSLTWLRNFKKPEGQLARWLEQLQEFDFEIVHCQGKQHVNADTLSHLPCRQNGRENHNTALIATTPLILRGHCEDVRTAQLADPTIIGPLLQAKEVDRKPSAEQTKNQSNAA